MSSMVKLIFLLIYSTILILIQFLPKSKTLNLPLNRALITWKIAQECYQVLTMKIRSKTMIHLKQLLKIKNLKMITHLRFYNAILLNFVEILTTKTSKVPISLISTMFKTFYHEKTPKISPLNLLVKNSKLTLIRMIRKMFQKE